MARGVVTRESRRQDRKEAGNGGHADAEIYKERAMRIEDITVEALAKESKENLYQLRLRCLQFYGKNFEKTNIQQIGILKRSDLLEGYRLLLKEIHSRGLRIAQETDLDRSVFRKAMFGLDIKCLSEKTIVEDYVAISGSFVDSPLDAENVSIVIKEQSDEIESILKEALSNEICKEISFAQESKDLEEMGIPLYDLVLRPKESLRRINISKPEVTGNYVRIPIGSECEVTATINISEEKGIKALYCGRDKRIRTYLFETEKWTMAEAKKWIAEQAFKKVKEKTDVHKDLSPAKRKECDEETARIKENAERPEAKKPHQFKAAKFTHKNGHPRCLTCGDEQSIGEVCNMPDSWYEKHEWDDKEAWKEERAKLRSKGMIKSDLFFKFYKQVKSKQMVGGIVYEPNVVDTQGDYADAEEIQKAMYDFMEKYAKNSKRIKINHKGTTHTFPIMECFQPEHDIQRGGQTVKKGAWWLMLKVTDKGVWNDIEAGKINGFSMGGTATSGKKT